MSIGSSPVGPVVKFCPDCGAEVSRELIHAGTRVFILPIPRTCPECDAPLYPRVRSPVPPEGQTQLPGVA
jgi:rubredoxin